MSAVRRALPFSRADADNSTPLYEYLMTKVPAFLITDSSTFNGNDGLHVSGYRATLADSIYGIDPHICAGCESNVCRYDRSRRTPGKLLWPRCEDSAGAQPSRRRCWISLRPEAQVNRVRDEFLSAF